MNSRRVATCFSFAASLALGASSHAASLTWDASGANPSTPTDGAGTWSSTNANWSGGGVDSGWNNAGNNDAVIGRGGVGGTISATENITANSLTFNSVTSGNYTINSSNSSVLTLTSGTAFVNTTATVSLVVTGTNGLSKIGNGTLGLGSVNTYTGTTYILGGSLQNRVVNALPTATVVAIGLVGSNTTATLDVRANQTVSGISAVGSDLTKNLISNSQTASTVLTINPDGAGAAAADSTFGGIIKNGDATHILGITKAGSHTLTLTGANTYTGTTTVTAGTMLVNGSLSSASPVTVASAGRFGGTGTVGAVSVSGTLAAGNNAIGTFNTGDLSLGSTSTLENELGRSSGVAVSDLANVAGRVTLASGANLQLSLLSGLSDPVSGDIFFLLANDGTDAINGVFTKLNGLATTLNEGSTFSFNSQTYEITYLADQATSSFTGGNDIAIQAVSVPEPATCAFLGLGAAALLWRRRRTA